MQKRISVFCFIGLMCMAASLSAQHFSVKGKIVDTANSSILSKGSVAVIRSRDSMLVKYTWADTAGRFTLIDLQPGKYIVLITYPEYADYIDTLSVTKDTNLGIICMITRVRLLEEVVVKQTVSAIRIKRDTTEYAADSFKVHANASVEDLLKKLPGIQVDRYGNITAQGQKVKKVLVDGEEFFGDDPTLVTQNLLADMVDKVQLFDKKSDQAAFTGINDGVKDKTINIKLKASKKKGEFGKLAAGAGLDGYFDAQAMLNVFRDKLKFAAYGIASNTGVAGLGWKDQQNYGDAGSSGAQVADGGLYIAIGNDEDGISSWSGTYGGRGLPLVQTGGAHFSNKWNNDKNTVNTNYKIMNLGIEGVSNTLFANRLPGNAISGSQRESFKGTHLRNKLNAAYDVQLSTTSSIKITADGSIGQKDFGGNYEGRLLGGDSSLLNTSQKNVSNRMSDEFFNSSILWRKKFKKKGRTFSLNLKNNYSAVYSEGYLYSKIHFIKGNSVELVDQFKKNEGAVFNFDSKLVYTEPLSVAASLVANYGIVANDARSEKKAFDKNSFGTYSVLNPNNSNSYNYSQFAQRMGLSYNYSKAKWLVNFGSNIAVTNYNQHDLFRDTYLKRNFINWFPRAVARYSLSSQRQLSVEYSGNSVQPSINQVQPVVQNDDPLNTVVGNPYIKPAFRSLYRIIFTDNREVSQRYFYTSLTYSTTHNAISNDVFTDVTTGASKIYFLNLSGNNNLSLHSSYDLTIKKVDVNMSINTDVGVGNFVSQVNGMVIRNRSASYSLGMFAGKSKPNKYDFRLDVNGAYYTAESNGWQREKIAYISFNIHPMMDIFLPGKFQLHTEMDYSVQEKSAFFSENVERTLLSLYISKKLLKKDNLILKCSLTDILNQNFGIDRSLNTNYISQNIYNTVGRIFLLSATWNFNSQKQK